MNRADKKIKTCLKIFYEMTNFDGLSDLTKTYPG